MDICHPSQLYSTIYTGHKRDPIYTGHKQDTSFEFCSPKRKEWSYTGPCNGIDTLNNETTSFVSSETKYSQSCRMSYREFKAMACWTEENSVERNSRRRKSGLTATLANRRCPRDVVLCLSSGGSSSTLNSNRISGETDDTDTSSADLRPKKTKGDAYDERSKAEIICKDTSNYLNYLRSKLTKQYPYERLSDNTFTFDCNEDPIRGDVFNVSVSWV